MAVNNNLDAFKDVQTETKVDANKKFRIGFIGCGGIAHSHMKALLTQPDVEIVAGCDIVPGKAKAFFEEFGLEGVKHEYADHKEMIDDKSLNLDAVTICTLPRC